MSRRYDFQRSDTALDVVLRCIAVGILVLAAVGWWGCATSKLDKAARTVGATETQYGAARTLIRQHIAADLHEQCKDAEDADACVDARLRHWRPTEAVMDSAAALIDAMTDAVLAWAVAVVAGEASEDEYPADWCDLSQRTIDAVLRVVAEAGAPLTIEIEVPCE